MTHVAYDRLADAGTVRRLGEVRLRMLMLLPIITSIEDRLAGLGEAALQRQPELRHLIGDLAAWIVDDDRQRQSGDEIRAAIAARQSALDGLAPRERIITISLRSGSASWSTSRPTAAQSAMRLPRAGISPPSRWRSTRSRARRQSVTCDRVYDRDIPEFPLAVDVYHDRAHLQEFDTGWKMLDDEYAVWVEAVRQNAAQALDLPLQHIYYKLRARQRGESQYEKTGAAVRRFYRGGGRTPFHRQSGRSPVAR